MELPVSLFAWDRGFFFTVKQLYTRPGHAIAEYLAGKRASYFRPLPLLAFCAGILGLIGLNMPLPDDLAEAPEKLNAAKTVMDWVNSHYVWIELMLLPVMSLSTWLWFMRHGQNMVEHIIVNAFLASQRLALNLALLPMLLISNSKPVLLLQGGIVSMVSFGMFVWTFHQMFGAKNPTGTAFRSISAYASAYLLLGLVGGLIGALLVMAGMVTIRMG